MASNSNIGRPCCNKCKMVANCYLFVPFSFFKPPSITCSTMEIRLCWEYIISFLAWVHFCSHKTPFSFLPKCAIFRTIFVFPTFFSKCVQFKTQNNLLSLHSWTHNAFHTVNFSKIILEQFYPWKLCSLNVSTLTTNIIVFLRFLWQWFVFFVC